MRLEWCRVHMHRLQDGPPNCICETLCEPLCVLLGCSYQTSQRGETMQTKTRTTVPTNTAANAAYVATRAAMDARKLGMTPDQCANVYTSAYAEALRGER